MVISHLDKLEKKEVTHPQAKDALMQVLISPEDGWEGYVMRVFEVKPGGNTPKHAHPWPHINYIIAGEGIFFHEDEEVEIRGGSYAYLPAGALHQFKNPGKLPLKFICIVPEEGHK